MTPKYIKISPEAKSALAAAKITGNQFDLVGQLSPQLYRELKKLFSEIGVVWNRAKKTHFLESGAKEQIDFLLGGGEVVDKKKTLQKFYTPESLAKRVVELAKIEEYHVCLEPSCGGAAILFEMFSKSNNVTGYDIDKDAIQHLVNNYSDKFPVRCVDFLEVPYIESYDRVCMNPPFSANQDVKHVAHAYKMLKPGGRLVAIMAGNTSRKPFVELIKDKAHQILPVEDGAFADAGANVKTIILILDKP